MCARYRDTPFHEKNKKIQKYSHVACSIRGPCRAGTRGPPLSRSVWARVRTPAFVTRLKRTASGGDGRRTGRADRKRDGLKFSPFINRYRFEDRSLKPDN